MPISMSEFLQRLPEFLGNHLVLTLALIGVVIALIVMGAVLILADLFNPVSILN